MIRGHLQACVAVIPFHHHYARSRIRMRTQPETGDLDLRLTATACRLNVAFTESLPRHRGMITRETPHLRTMTKGTVGPSFDHQEKKARKFSYIRIMIAGRRQDQTKKKEKRTISKMKTSEYDDDVPLSFPADSLKSARQKRSKRVSFMLTLSAESQECRGSSAELRFAERRGREVVKTGSPQRNCERVIRH